jgi:hypothetical protein
MKFAESLIEFDPCVILVYQSNIIQIAYDKLSYIELFNYIVFKQLNSLQINLYIWIIVFVFCTMIAVK